MERGIAGSGNGKSRGLRVETADQLEKTIVGSRGCKTAGETRAQSPKSNGSSGGSPLSKNNTKINTFIVILFTTTSEIV